MWPHSDRLKCTAEIAANTPGLRAPPSSRFHSENARAQASSWGWGGQVFAGHKTGKKRPIMALELLPFSLLQTALKSEAVLEHFQFSTPHRLQVKNAPCLGIPKYWEWDPPLASLEPLSTVMQLSRQRSYSKIHPQDRKIKTSRKLWVASLWKSLKNSKDETVTSHKNRQICS